MNWTLRSVTLATCLRPLWIQFVALTEGRLFIGVAKVELRVIALRLEDVGPLHQLARFAAVR